MKKIIISFILLLSLLYYCEVLFPAKFNIKQIIIDDNLAIGKEFKLRINYDCSRKIDDIKINEQSSFIVSSINKTSNQIILSLIVLEKDFKNIKISFKTNFSSFNKIIAISNKISVSEVKLKEQIIENPSFKTKSYTIFYIIGFIIVGYVLIFLYQRNNFLMKSKKLLLKKERSLQAIEKLNQQIKFFFRSRIGKKLVGNFNQEFIANIYDIKLISQEQYKIFINFYNLCNEIKFSSSNNYEELYKLFEEIFYFMQEKRP